MNVHTKATMASLPIFLQQQDRSEETVSVPIVPISQSPESIFEKKQAASSDQFPQEFAYVTLITDALEYCANLLVNDNNRRLA